MKKKKVTFKNSFIPEKEKRHNEIMARLNEAYPMAGNTGGEDALWRSLSTSAERDLNQVTQKRMQEIAFYLFDTNPMAHRIIEIVRDFVVGDGFTFQAEDDQVAEVIQNFWEDPDNCLDDSMDENVLELSMFGENIFPTWVNPIDGSVKLGYIDPAWVVNVTKDKKNPRWNDKVIWKAPKMRKERELDIVRCDRDPRSPTFGYMIGDVFYFGINKPINSSRGRSDLLSLADWLDGHDQFLFARLERAFLLNTFIWDITAEGMNKEELEKFLSTIPTPKPGSIRAHNERVTWQAISPKLEGDDASNEARLFKNQILGGAGFPEHWFAEGSKTTRATAMEMGLPTLKKLKARQKKIKYQYYNIVKFVIDQAILHGTLPKDVNKKFKIIPPSIISKDDQGLATSLNTFADALSKAQSAKWITGKEAQTSFRMLINNMGIDDLSSYGEEPLDELDPDNPDNVDDVKTAQDTKKLRKQDQAQEED